MGPSTYSKEPSALADTPLSPTLCSPKSKWIRPTVWRVEGLINSTTPDRPATRIIVLESSATRVVQKSNADMAGTRNIGSPSGKVTCSDTKTLTTRIRYRTAVYDQSDSAPHAHCFWSLHS